MWLAVGYFTVVAACLLAPGLLTKSIATLHGASL